jgi:predicted component of type VI protein secretion system
MRRDPNEAGNVTLHLLDSAHGHAIQSWRFDDCCRIRIGRADDNDISLADKQVSRLHVELIYGDGKWTLYSHGRNGTRIDGAQVPEYRLKDRSIFQLGSTGPTFQFVTVNDSTTSTHTIDDIDPTALDFLVIDQQRQAEQVQQITDSDAFQHLQREARRLKQSDSGSIQESA